MTGPAHQTAAAASVLPRLKASNGSMPMAYSTTSELVMWVDRPGQGDHGLGDVGERLGRRVRGVAGQEVERDLGRGAGPPGGHGVAELVEQREHGDGAGQPQAELVAVQRHDEHHEEQEARPHVDREAEDAHQALNRYG